MTPSRITKSAFRISAKKATEAATLVALLLCGCAADEAVAQPHPYQTTEMLEQPLLFAPGIISTDAIEYGPTFTPDGKTLYFTRRASWQDVPAIYVSHFEEGAWQEPTVARFSGQYSDEYPSLDGNRLYFASKRPTDDSGERSHNDLWFVERTEAGWGTPQRLPTPINSEGIDSHPHTTERGDLYFHSNRPGGHGGVDIYRAQLVEGRYTEPTVMPFNSEATDGEAIVGPQDDFVIFYSEREGTRGKGDLFIVYNDDGAWSSVANLGDVINTADYEWTPAVSPDGRYLFYAHLAGSDSDIYQIDLHRLLDPR